MRSVVVYESLWGNTAAIARAIAEGLGPDAVAVSTAEATPEALTGAGLIVAGAPLLGFTLPTEKMRESIRTGSQYQSNPGDFSHPSMASWIRDLTPLKIPAASFETRIWWSPGSAAKRITTLLTQKGLSTAAPPERFLVTDRFGPLKDGELDRARAWGETLAAAVR